MSERRAASPRVKAIQRKGLVLLVMGGAISTIDRAALSVANPLIRHDLHLSISEMGLLLSAFLWAYAFAQFPIGAMIDRFGPRRLLTCGLALWSAAQMAGGFVTGTVPFFFARMLLGVGEAPQFPTAGRVVRDWFSVRDRGVATGIFASASTLGTGLAAPLLTGLMLNFGWKWMFITMGVIGLVVSAIWFAVYRDPREIDLSDAEAQYLHEDKKVQDLRRITAREWKGLFRSSTTWGLLLGFFGVIYVNWLFNAWLPGYLEIARHMSVSHTGWAAAVPYSFAVAGALSAGALVDRLARQGMDPIMARKVPFCCVMVLETISVVVAALVPDNAIAIAFLSVAMFCGAAATTCAWALVTVVGPANCTGSLGSLQTFGGYIGGALAPLVTGYIVQSTGSFVPALFTGAAMALAAAFAYLILIRRPITLPDLHSALA